MTPHPQIGVHLALAEGACQYATQSKKCYILWKLQGKLNSMVVWCECWITKEKYRTIPWRLPIHMVKTKVYTTFISYIPC
jgi:hypothetical protein